MSTFALTELKEQRIPAGYSRAGLTFVLAALTWIGPFSIDTYLPSLPAISESLGASAAQVQQTMTAFLLSFAIMSLWHGAMAGGGLLSYRSWYFCWHLWAARLRAA